jgi:tetratricopeptide (TPR) repeat protein
VSRAATGFVENSPVSLSQANSGSGCGPAWWDRERTSALAVLLTAFATYLVTLGYDFAFDDHLVIPAAWQVGAAPPLDVLQAPVRAGEVVLLYFRPLTALSYWVDGTLWHGNPGGFHLTNVLWHAVVSVLIFVVARHLLPAGPGPLLAGLLFAVHPVHVEPVAWVQGRVDLLSSAGVLAAVLSAVAGANAAGVRRHLWWGASAAAHLLALLAKETAIVAPLLVGLVLICRLTGERWRRHDIAVLGSLHALAFLAYVALRAAALGSPLRGVLEGGSLLDRLPLPFHLIPLYLRLLLVPVGLNPKHDVMPPSGFLDSGVLWGVALVAALAMTVIWWRRRVPGLAAGAAWTLIAWLPASNIIPIRGFVAAERYVYLASAGWCIAIAALAAGRLAGPRARHRVMPTAAAVLLALAGLAAWQTGIWANMQAFYEGLVRRNPGSAFAHNNLGSVYLGIGEDARAEAELREALRLDPGHAGALNNLGLVAQRRGDLAAARRLYQQAIAARPTQADAWNNLGTLHQAEGDLPQAVAAYHEAVRLDPGTPRFLANLGEVLAAQGRRQEAAVLLERAIRLDPTVPRWQASLAVLRAGGTP